MAKRSDQNAIERRTAAGERKQRKAEELRIRREAQLVQAAQQCERLTGLVASAEKKVASREALSSHLEGFYEEIDKLAKGRSLVETTPLVVQQINDIVRDAKAIIDGDPYLDRVKEFVPAGNNPSYPDVLLIARTIQQCLLRCEDKLTDQEKRLDGVLAEALTIKAALQSFLDTDEWPTKADVDALIDVNVADDWFVTDDQGCEVFNMDDLDTIDIEQHLTEAT